MDRSNLRERIQRIRDDDERRKKELIAQQNEFDEVLSDAHEAVWWRRFIQLISLRRQALSEQLEAGMFETRKEEERARGQISELKFILALDMRSKQLQTEKIGESNNGTAAI